MTTQAKLFMVYPALMVMCLPGGKPGTSTLSPTTLVHRADIVWEPPWVPTAPTERDAKPASKPPGLCTRYCGHMDDGINLTDRYRSQHARVKYQ